MTKQAHIVLSFAALALLAAPRARAQAGEPAAAPTVVAPGPVGGAGAPAAQGDVTEAMYSATEILYSSEVRRLVKDCLLKGGFAVPPDLTILVEIGTDGHARAVKVKEPIASASLECIAQGLSAIPFVASPLGYQVSARYSFTESGLKPPPKEIPPDVKIEPSGPLKDPAANRGIYMPTAFILRKGAFDFTSYWGYDIHLSYGISKYAEISFQTNPPIMAWGLIVSPKVSFPVGKLFRIGFELNAGFIWPYIVMTDMGAGGDELAFFVYGGAPLLMTIGSEDYSFTLAVHLEGLTVYQKHSNDYYNGEESKTHIDTSFIIFPSLGWSFKIADGVKLNLQTWTFANPAGDFEDMSGRFWGGMYGFRFYGRKYHVDVNFLFLLWDEAIASQMYMPLGYPLIAFGFQK